MRGAEGVGVIVAEDAAAALQGVLVQVAGGPRLAKSAQVVGQVVGAAQSATSMGGSDLVPATLAGRDQHVPAVPGSHGATSVPDQQRVIIRYSK